VQINQIRTFAGLPETDGIAAQAALGAPGIDGCRMVMNTRRWRAECRQGKERQNEQLCPIWLQPSECVGATQNGGYLQPVSGKPYRVRVPASLTCN
jgi:hypothetical protein